MEKTLVYFASGNYREVWQNVEGYDRIYLVDRYIRFNSIEGDRAIPMERPTERSVDMHRRMPMGMSKTIGKVTLLRADCLQAVDFFKRNNIFIDCLIAVNEGMLEGGGIYPINGDIFMGYVMPILKDNYIHIANLKYYRESIRLDIPYEKTKMDNFIPIETLTTYVNWIGPDIETWNMKKIKSEITSFDLNGTKINFIYDSIWNYEKYLDIIYIPKNIPFLNDFFQRKDKVRFIEDFNLDEIRNNFKFGTNIGFMPWNKGDYSDFLEQFENFSGDDIYLFLNFFHLNQNDYKKIKEILKNKK